MSAESSFGRALEVKWIQEPSSKTRRLQPRDASLLTRNNTMGLAAKHPFWPRTSRTRMMYKTQALQWQYGRSTTRLCIPQKSFTHAILRMSQLGKCVGGLIVTYCDLFFYCVIAHHLPLSIHKKTTEVCRCINDLRMRTLGVGS